VGQLTRRTFLARASIATAAVTGGAAVISSMPASAISAATAMPTVRGAAPSVGEPLVAHVRNVATGEVAVLMGTREVVYHDRALVGRLLGAMR
jgi:hypothetical protein